MNHYHYTMNGLDNVYLLNGFTIKATPYGEAVHIDNAEELDKSIARTIIFTQPTITGKQIRFMRQLAGLSQTDLSKTLGVDVQTLARWEKNGRTKKATETLARFIMAAYFGGNQKIKTVFESLKAIDHAKNARMLFDCNHGAWEKATAE